MRDQVKSRSVIGSAFVVTTMALAVALALIPEETYSHPGASGIFAPLKLPKGQVDSDRQLLIDLYYDMGGQNWKSAYTTYSSKWGYETERRSMNWLSSAPIGSWDRVTAVGGRVTELDFGTLSDSQRGSRKVEGLSGNISPELGNLTNLTILRLTGDGLNGNIPSELGNLTNLTHLNLWHSNLSGNIPPELGNLTNLTHLDLRENNLSGNIPPELGNLTNLTHLYLNGNKLSGSIPPELGNLTNLEELRLKNTGLSGCIPMSLKYIANSDIPQIALSLPFCAAPPPAPTSVPTRAPTPTATVGIATITDMATPELAVVPKPATPIAEPTVNFHASQTEVSMGEPVALTLSVANSIINPEMTLQLVLQLPSGVSISGEGLGDSCSVQCSVTYKVPTGENRNFPLTAVPNQVGSFNIAGRMEWYFGDDLATHAGKSASLTLNAMKPVEVPTPAPSISGEPTVNLHATQTEVGIGEPVVLTLSADNSIAKPQMTLKFILQVPSGWSMSGTGFTEACSGQCTATYQVPSGDQKSIFLEMLPNQAGSFNAEALMEWYFGDDVSTLTRESKSLALNVVRSPANSLMPTYFPPPNPGQVTAAPPPAAAVPAPAQQGDSSASCGISPEGAASNGAGDFALLGLPLLGLAGLLGRRRGS